MVKVAIASIPALIILVLVAIMAIALVTAVISPVKPAHSIVAAPGIRFDLPKAPSPGRLTAEAAEKLCEAAINVKIAPSTASRFDYNSEWNGVVRTGVVTKNTPDNAYLNFKCSVHNSGGTWGVSNLEIAPP